MMRWLVSCAAVLVLLLASSRSAHAYSWMIRSGYTQCATCHADPAGGGLLNPYGRAQGEILMRMRYGSAPDHEPGPLAEPLWGAFSAPRDLLLGGDARLANIRLMPKGSPTQSRFILMQADAQGQFSLGRVRANASLGYVSEGGNAAAITKGDSTDAKVVSRVHWLGVDIGRHDEVLVRAGRMNLPFGLRSIEHTMFVRSETKTDTNTGQSYGVAIDYHRDAIRAGIMAIAGNFAVSPDRFRGRGYSAFAEYAISPIAAVGVSSLATNTQLDTKLLTPVWRHAHGVFARYSPIRLAVISAEWDFLYKSQPTPDDNTLGGAGFVQVDLEPVQGLHVGPSFEYDAPDFGSAKSYSVWGSAWWFFLPHADLRFDLVGQSLGSPAGTTSVVTAITQVHVYL